MNILYIHGFGSKFDASSEKIVSLSALGTVYGIDLDYTQHRDEIVRQCRDAIDENNIDLVVGTSMGGYTASIVAGDLPFVSINPVLDPRVALQKYLGANIDHNGNDYFLSKEAVESHVHFRLDGSGLILLDSGDEVIPPMHTYRVLWPYYTVHLFTNGSHRFEHMKDAIVGIEEFYQNF